MNSNMKSWLMLCLLCLTVLFSTKVCSDEISAPQLEKIYIQPGQLHIIPEGIFFLSENGILENACGVFHDGGSLYIMKKKSECYICPSCRTANEDNICWKRGCPLYGK